MLYALHLFGTRSWKASSYSRRRVAYYSMLLALILLTLRPEIPPSGFDVRAPFIAPAA